MYKKLFIVFLSFIAFPLLAQEVYKMGQGIKNADGLIFYSLPRTSVLVKVNCYRTVTYVGPYVSFAEEFLGMKGLPIEDKTEWRMDSIIIQTIQESDPDAFYAIHSDKKFDFEKMLTLSKAGLIFDPSTCVNYPEIKAIENKVPDFKMDEYTMHGFNAEAYDTLYKTIVKDTMYVKIPVVKSKTNTKTLRDKAKDAADVILKIRQRRFELLLAEEDPFAEAQVLKYAISELDKTEKEFLTLFTGKRIEKSYTYWFQHVPDNKELNAELFRFSVFRGVIPDKSDAGASPVIISYEHDGRMKNLKDWINSIPDAEKGTIKYRIPESALAKITYNGQQIAYKRIQISQFGVLLPYSVK